MALSAAQINKVNRMNRAAADASMGTLLGTLEMQGTTAMNLQSVVGSFRSGSYACTSDDATAHSSTIIDRTNEGLAIAAWIVQVYRSGILMGNIKVTCSGFVLTLEDNSTDYAVTEGDVVNYFVC